MAHRSVRSFTDEPLQGGVLELLVRAGTRASTSSNMQAYTIIAITDADLKAHMAGLCADQPQIHESAVFLAFCADLHRLTLACGMHGADTTAMGHAEALLVAVIDTALVMQNVAVAAESLGLGICMIGAMRNRPHDVADALKLPRGVVAVSGLCIGTPADHGDPRPRLPLDAVLHRNGYRDDDASAALIAEYDTILARWYAERDLHPSDPRWSAVMARRLPGIAARASVGTFLHDQGLNTL
ncbi:MAG: NADPH-dependent oxidoreductase [Phycisphaerae bacterium]